MWYVNARGPAEQNTYTYTCGPAKLVKNHYSVPVVRRAIRILHQATLPLPFW